MFRILDCRYFIKVIGINPLHMKGSRRCYAQLKVDHKLG